MKRRKKNQNDLEVDIRENTKNSAKQGTGNEGQSDPNRSNNVEEAGQ